MALQLCEARSKEKHWKIVIRKEKVDELKNDQKFWALLALARAVNTLRFVQMPLISPQNDDSPAGSRARFNSFFFGSALYHESRLLVKELKVHFEGLPEFQELVKVTESMDAEEVKSVLRDLRNKLVFHFDIGKIGEQFKSLELSDHTFLSAIGETNGDVYYELSDLCALRVFYGSLPQDDADAAAWEALLARTKAMTGLIVDFAEKAELLIVAVLTNEGWGEAI